MSQTILKAGRRSAFRYLIEGGMDARDLSEIEAMDPVLCTEPDWHVSVMDSISLRHHLSYMRHRNLGFRTVECCDEGFRAELAAIDAALPNILGAFVSERYLHGTERLDDLCENMENSAPRGDARGRCGEIVGSFLERLDSGLRPDACVLTVVPVGFEGNFEIVDGGSGRFETVLMCGISALRRSRFDPLER